MGKSYPLIVSDCRGGRNGADPPHMLPEDQCQEALNVDWWEGTVANKRRGATALSTTFSSGGPFTSVIGSLIRHVPGNDETAAELWGFDGAATPVVGRLAGATTWVAPTMVDSLADAAAGRTVTGASLNGMLYLGYDSSVNRLHVWDPSDSKVRRVGLATPDPPTVATQGGAGLSFTRHYRIRTVDISGSDTKRRSEASTSVSITITDDTGVTVTRPTLPTNEDETHWEVEYADASTGPWYRASQVATGTSTYSDTASSISTTNLSPSTGINLPPPSARFLVTDDNRLVMAGAFESSTGTSIPPKDTRVWWTPVLGSTDVGDSERIVTNTEVGAGYLDVEAAITGLGLLGAIYVFSYRRIWKLVRTGDSTRPFVRYALDTGGIGCIAHKSIVAGEDENGTPCLYFLSHKGPYRIGPNGLQYCGQDIEDLWAGVNLSPTTGIVGHGIYHAAIHQVWWFVPTSAGAIDNPDLRLVFDTKLGRAVAADAVRKGWSRATGQGAKARCAVMFANTVAASMSRDLKPYIGMWDANNTIWKCDSSATDDAGTAFQAYLDTREYGTVGMNHALRDGVVIAQAASGVNVVVTARTDFAFNADGTGTVSLTPVSSENRVQKRIEGLQTAGVGTFALRIGDSGAIANQWTVDTVLVNVTEQEPRS